jgi:predicted nucleotide-binding protein
MEKKVQPPKIFIASSNGAKSQAREFIKGCSRADVTFFPWWEQFNPGQTLMDELTRIRDKVNRAIVILTPESDTNIRGQKHSIPNLNALLEFGFFYGAFGPANVTLVRYGNVHLPSNLGGYIHITGSKYFTSNRSVKVSKKTKTEFERWLDAPKQASRDLEEKLIARREESAK